MANKGIFGGGGAATRAPLRRPDTVNEAGGAAFSLDAETALATLMLTGTFSGTYYQSAEAQLDKFVELARQCSSLFLAQCAIYARQNGFMKDAPAVACVLLMERSRTEQSADDLITPLFDAVINNGKMLRNFVQIVRSGKFGSKNINGKARRLVQRWFDRRRTDTIFRQSIGASPSLGDVLKMAHPDPADGAHLRGSSGLTPDSIENRVKERASLYAYLIGCEEATGRQVTEKWSSGGGELSAKRKWRRDRLPACVRDFENLKDGSGDVIPNIPFQMLTGTTFKGVTDKKLWKHIAETASWHTLRMNLATFARHGVFDYKGMPEKIAARLADPVEVAKAKVFPYQLLAAYDVVEADASIPRCVVKALHDAAEASVVNVPEITGPFNVLLDISSSMTSVITGTRAGHVSKMTCMDAASIMAAAFLRKNPQGSLVLFNDSAQVMTIDTTLPLLRLAKDIRAKCSGGTNLGAAFHALVLNKLKGHVVVVSDNQSWAGGENARWSVYHAANPKGRLVTVNIQPVTTTTLDPETHLHIAGWSDSVFSTVGSFFGRGRKGTEEWLKEIREIRVTPVGGEDDEEEDD